MQLLTPEKVNSDKGREERERRGRIRELSSEETKITQSLNLARAEDESERKRIADDFAKFEEETLSKKKALQEEVHSLEGRKAEALKPVKDIEREAEAILQANKVREVELDQREQDLSEREDELIEKCEDIDDTAELLKEREREIEKREVSLKAEEERARLSSHSLSDKWLEYHKEVAKANAEMKERENKVLAETEANNIIKKELDKKALEQKEKDREIQDRYATLARAQQEILGKKQ